MTMTMSANEQPPGSPPLGKHLASTDKKTRDAAVKRLAAFLSTPAQNALSKSDMARLWKAIFYCYWMSDKPLVQQALSTELAQLLLNVANLDASLAFLRGFWEATVREWNGIDRLRLDKYYMLVRKFVNASFRLLIRADWEKSAVSEYNDILSCRGGPLCPQDIRVPSSLSYHLADIFLAELDKALATQASGSESKGALPAPLTSLLHPFLELASRTNSNITYQRIFDQVLNPLFLALTPQGAASSEPPTRKRPRLDTEPALENILACSCLEDPQKEGKVGKAQLRKGLLRKMFDVASGPDVRESNRRKMHAVWRAAMAEEEDADKADAQN